MCTLTLISVVAFAQESVRDTAPQVSFEENNRGNFVMKIFSASGDILAEEELVYPGIQFVPSPEPAPVPDVPEKPTADDTKGIFLQPEPIFDTVFVDLKVDGQDGPVTVAAGSRIVISWISEGAARCRGNWSRNDIKSSGTVAGRLKHSIAIKVSCIDMDGHRADDSVLVNILDVEMLSSAPPFFAASALSSNGDSFAMWLRKIFGQ